ncbi:MAG: hypothetical protein ACLR8P_16785 [Clostridium fessum]
MKPFVDGCNASRPRYLRTGKDFQPVSGEFRIRLVDGQARFMSMVAAKGR